jgi:predicted hydrocarbon binding protein
MFKFLSDQEDNVFTWDALSSKSDARENLGQEMPVLVYRLFQYTLRDVLNKTYGPNTCIDIFRKAGEIAGLEFAKNMLDLTLPFDKFMSNMQNVLRDAKIGILRIESVDTEKQEMVLSVAEDLDCSGLPVTGETVCNYDEGFIAGILKAYTGQKHTVVETDCWASGDRVCRFNAKVDDSDIM